MLYQGSKASIGAKIAKVIEFYQPGRVFVEPFCGGLNLTQYVKGIKYCSDANPYLIAMWEKILYEDWLGPHSWDEGYYKTVRDNKNDFPPEIVGWVGFCSFGGGFFNGERKPDDKDRNYIKEYQQNFIKQRDVLKNVILRCCPYVDVKLNKPSVIYCDPPYANTKEYSSNFQRHSFWEWCRQQTKEHLVLISEYTAPKDFKIVWSVVRKSGMRLGVASEHQENLYIHESQFTRTFYEPRS